MGGTSQTDGVITGGATSARVTIFDTPSFSVSYSSTTGYSLSDAVNAVAFGRAQFAGDSSMINETAPPR
jgi:hypothetical protein